MPAQVRILLLNQTFYPDVVATSQYLTQFALGLAERGHEVSVVSSRRAYDDPERLFPAREVWKGVQIYRIRSSGLGKSAKWKRAVDFATFLLSCLWRLLTVPRPDVVVALTSPPLISFIAAWYAKVRRCRFVYWVMDLNPDEAVAAGWLRPDSLPTRVLDALSRFSFQRADKIIALDRFMTDRIAAKGIAPEKIEVIPPWAHDDVVRFDAAGREKFRREQGIDDAFAVMYSGNHSPCHPLATLLEAARELEKGENVTKRFMFLFVGGGSELPKVREFAVRHGLRNVRCLAYQPLEALAGSLSAADLQVVVMGDPFVGTIHPCKVYNILSVGAPILYIGPAESHVSDIFSQMERARNGAPRTTYEARHGDVVALVKALREASRGERGDEKLYREVSEGFSREALLQRQIRLVESLAAPSH
jgi:colanic acid biosynthesis glycosyl transferase WcaI